MNSREKSGIVVVGTETDEKQTENGLKPEKYR